VKVIIKATQEELDEKREELIKAVAGKKFVAVVRPVGQSRAGDERQPFHKAQKEVLEYWTKKYNQTVEAIKRDIDEVISQ
jgi:hypothetical protein